MTITTLPPEEWDRVRQTRDDTVRLATVTGVPLAEFTAAATACYAAIGQPSPVVVVAPSPLVALAWSAILRDRGQLDGQLGDQLGDQLYNHLYNQLGGQLRGQLYDQLGDQLRDQLYGVHWGGWRMAWMTHWLHIATIPGIAPPAPGLVAKAEAYRTFCATPTIPLRGVVIGVGPHLAVHFDADRRLHNADGAAWSWVTGEAIHAWHGTRVPEWVISSPTVDRIASERNTEIRRCAIESLGWPAYLTALNLTPISVEADPGNPGHELALYDVPGARQLFGGDVRLLVMDNASRDRDGTRRTYAETVPAELSSAVDAAAWQFNVDPTIYRALQRAT